MTARATRRRAPTWPVAIPPARRRCSPSAAAGPSWTWRRPRWPPSTWGATDRRASSWPGSAQRAACSRRTRRPCSSRRADDGRAGGPRPAPDRRRAARDRARLGGLRRSTAGGPARCVRPASAYRAAGPARRRRCDPDSVLLELCCGVGPVAATVDAGEIHLADLDPIALECARVNVPRGRAHLCDLYAALPVDLRGRIDVVAANAPYVPTGSILLMPHEARDHEHRRALDGGRRRRRRAPPRSPPMRRSGSRPTARS